MSNLKNRNILIGISGGIAAYKVPDLVRRLRKKGAEVRIIMTELAKSFVTPLVLQAISGYPVLQNQNGITIDRNQKESFIQHIDLGKWADLILLVPATADLLARINIGMANDLLTATCLASCKRIAVVPSMNTQMYQASTTQKNINELRKRGILIWGPNDGEQICGEYGFGRMLEPIQIIDLISNLFQYDQDMKGIRVAITAGPTQEKFDSIRFLSNYSSGKMGFAIAQAASERGAKVTLISGPVHLETPPCVKRIDVINSFEMYEEVKKIVENQDIFIGCAAVSDYKPERQYLEEKFKSDLKKIKLTLVKNIDIIRSVGKMIKNRPYTVGFAAEINSEDLISNAHVKKINKNLDLICANNISLKNHGFHTEGNSLYLIWSKERVDFLPYDLKIRISHQLLSKVLLDYEKKNRR
ncbi:bifunctional phosphopantothenoylcysteine decarboxylase/phosphopantothenate--cysteine ligase CoaBC [Candidatus Riesia pediculicola]|uniref:bifunctional phosphopantothenoylcysteine decarboxylase/phosphopantothenate--cysteine ligase CoaBC n=1 Tax=Candidatus Riesia pediculicola TaxID=401619 RepID=UPI0009C2E047|nr:bifunctional phosphopantothenoylcysteine decarboxylase/phosphopantothenate--cysteine ligase CoaBC [Candidatus Riesia pediculicola]ARC54055.1 bifunctional phosphopantothenoylcysteine decarboxylase/phosphopantothenate synthase [Candidatus Riesia pediculicola]